MENNPYDKLIGSSADPYTNQIADECGLATNYHNLTHPSVQSTSVPPPGSSAARGTAPRCSARTRTTTSSTS